MRFCSPLPVRDFSMTTSPRPSGQLLRGEDDTSLITGSLRLRRQKIIDPPLALFFCLCFVLIIPVVANCRSLCLSFLFSFFVCDPEPPFRTYFNGAQGRKLITSKRTFSREARQRERSWFSFFSTDNDVGKLLPLRFIYLSGACRIDAILFRLGSRVGLI